MPPYQILNQLGTCPVGFTGTQYYEILAGVGVARLWLKMDKTHNIRHRGVFFGSVGSTNRDPGTVIGYTADKHVIMMVIDGRQARQ
ncbi:MAG: hypothetical protein IPG53_06250 [Ignavibacteriales bacterium]|nr:hypothetical protein [Ignavibacteriales bacterium]